MLLFPVSDSSAREALQDEEMKAYDWDEWFEEYLTSPELFDLSEANIKDPDKDIQIGTIVKYLKNADESTHHFNYQSIKKEELLSPGLTLPKIETLKEFKTETSDVKSFIKYDLDYHKLENYGHFTDDLWKASLLDIPDKVFTDLDTKPSHLIDIPSQNVNSPLYPSPPIIPSTSPPTSNSDPSPNYTNLNPFSMSLHPQDFSNSPYDQFYPITSTPLPSPFLPLHAHTPPSNTSPSTLISSNQPFLLNQNSTHICNSSISEKINLNEKSDVSSLQSSLHIQTADSTTNLSLSNNTNVHGSNPLRNSIQKLKNPSTKIKRLKRIMGIGLSGPGARAAGKTHPDQEDGSLMAVKRPRGRPRKERIESTVVKPAKRATKPATKINKTVGLKPRKRPEGNKSTHLWEYLLALLQDSELGSRWMRWVDEGEGVFEIRVGRSEDVARLWGKIKRNQTMTYDKMSRSLRWCKKYGSMLEVPEDKGYPKKRCFRFVHTNRDLTSMRQLLTAAKQSGFLSKTKRVEE